VIAARPQDGLFQVEEFGTSAQAAATIIFSPNFGGAYSTPAAT
jgi:hypothetical protein